MNGDRSVATAFSRPKTVPDVQVQNPAKSRNICEQLRKRTHCDLRTVRRMLRPGGVDPNNEAEYVDAPYGYYMVRRRPAQWRGTAQHMSRQRTCRAGIGILWQDTARRRPSRAF
jgi:hypothetical protein